jgi:hypothetical protein
MGKSKLRDCSSNDSCDVGSADLQPVQHIQLCSWKACAAAGLTSWYPAPRNTPGS